MCLLYVKESFCQVLRRIIHCFGPQSDYWFSECVFRFSWSEQDRPNLPIPSPVTSEILKMSCVKSKYHKETLAESRSTITKAAWRLNRNNLAPLVKNHWWQTKKEQAKQIIPMYQVISPEISLMFLLKPVRKTNWPLFDTRMSKRLINGSLFI